MKFLFTVAVLLLLLVSNGVVGINVDDYGAVGDGSTDDKTAIQNALDYLRDHGGTLNFTSGKTYIIGNGTDNCGLKLYNYSSSRTYLITTTGTEKATIKIADNTPIEYGNWGFFLKNSSNVTISNLEFDGNRETRDPESFGESPISDNYLIQVYNKCDGLRLKDLILKNGVVDNLLITTSDESDEATFITDFEMWNCVLENAYRNNMSVIRGSNFKIIGCEFNNAHGAEPEAGIDFEPNRNGANLGYSNMTIKGCSFSGNRRFGILLTKTVSNCGNSTVKNNYFYNNGMLIASDNNEIVNNVFRRMDHAPILGSNPEILRDGIIYFHTDDTMEGNNVHDNYFYDNTMPDDKNLIYLMYHSGGPNTIENNYEYNNNASFVYNNSKYSQNIGTNTSMTGREVGYWSMDASTITGTTISDLSDFNQSGTIYGNPTMVDEGSYEALDFSPDDKYIEIAGTKMLNIEMNITITAWLKWNGETTESQQIIVGRGDDWRFGIHGGGYLGFYGATSTPYTAGWTNVASPSLMPEGEWLFLSVTYDGRYTRVYINGEEKASELANGELGITSSIYIASLQDETYSFNGLIDEVKIYNYALSGATIDYLYDLKKDEFTVGMIENKQVKLSVSPNPIVDGVNISLKGNEESVNVMITSILGEVVLQKNMVIHGNAYINTQGIPSGQYIISVMNNNMTKLLGTTTVVVQ